VNYRLWFIDFAAAWVALGVIYFLWDWSPGFVAFTCIPVFIIYTLRATARSMAALRKRRDMANGEKRAV